MAQSKPKTVENALWNSVQRLLDQREFSAKELATYLELTEFDFNRAFRSKKAIPIYHWAQLSERLNCTVDSLINETLDIRQAAKFANKITTILPEKYADCQRAFSYSQSTLTVINHLTLFRSPAHVRNVLKRLQLTIPALESNRGLVSSQINMDLLSLLKTDGVSEKEFESMGTFSAVSLRDTSVGNTLEKCTSAQALFSKVFDQQYVNLETLCQIRVLKLSKNQCVIELTNTERVKDSFSRNVIGLRETCHFRRGLAASLSTFINLPSAHITELSCMYLGDDSCRYQFDFPHEHSNLRSLQTASGSLNDRSAPLT